MNGNRRGLRALSNKQRFVLLVTPIVLSFGFSNCHPGTDLTASRVTNSINSSPAPELQAPQPSSNDLSGKRDISSLRPKVDLRPESLERGTLLHATTSVQSKANRQASDTDESAHVTEDELLIPKGRRLMILLDNSCLSVRNSARASGLLKAKAQTLAETAVGLSGSGPVEGLKTQAYAFINPDHQALREVQLQAEADDCVLRVANNERLQLIEPRKSNLQILDSGALQSIPNDSFFSYLSHLPAINAPRAWNVFFSATRGIKKDVIVAVVDSGVDSSHPDLAANMWRDAKGNPGIDTHNLDFDPADDNGHGTHVAGLIGAVSDNRIGVAGVMGKHVKIMAIKVADKDGGGDPATIGNGVRYAADNGAEVINMSLGISGLNTDIEESVKYAASKGCVVVVAASNDYVELTDSFVVTPASQTNSIPGTLTVGSIDATSKLKSDFSNFSKTLVQISAPGSNDPGGNENQGIVSTTPQNTYTYMSGTSMASPIVAGSAALVIGLLKTYDVPYTNREIVDHLTRTATTRANLAEQFVDGRTLDLDRLSREFRSRYLVEGDGGTEAP